MPPTEYGAPLQIQEVKSAPGDTWEVAGYASTFGNTDLGGDVVQPGAFDASLASGRKVRFLYGHDPRQVLGSAAELKTDERGLFGRFRISPTQLGKDVHQLLKDGALDSFSIGYVPTDFEYAESKAKGDAGAEVRLLKAVDLLECSVVAMPMNPAALVTAVKAEDAALLPFDALWQRITESLKTGAAEAKALAARRGAEQRKLSDRSLDALRAGMAEAEALLTELRALIASQAAVVTPAQAKAAGGLALRLELARRRLTARGLIDEHGDIVP